MATKWLHSET